MGHRIYAIFAVDGCSKQFHIVKKCSRDQNAKDKGRAVRDFSIDCIQKMTEMLTMIAEIISH